MGLRITRKRDNFQALIRKAPIAARKLEQKHAEIWASVMRQIMPRDTGDMIESTAVVIGSSGHASILIKVSYWKFVNNGWVYFEGYHFVEISLEFIRPDWIKDLKKFVRYVKAE
jgi:hypothetical protein